MMTITVSKPLYAYVTRICHEMDRLVPPDMDMNSVTSRITPTVLVKMATQAFERGEKAEKAALNIIKVMDLYK